MSLPLHLRSRIKKYQSTVKGRGRRCRVRDIENAGISEKNTFPTLRRRAFREQLPKHHYRRPRKPLSRAKKTVVYKVGHPNV